MIKTKRVVDLTDSEYDACYHLNFGPDGWMQEDLASARESEMEARRYRYTQAIMITEGDHIVAWCLLIPVDRVSRYSAEFFVSPRHRRKGYGTLLFNEARKFGRFKPEVYPDSTNRGFFEKFPAQHVEGWK